MATNNAVYLTESGIVSYDGTGTFYGRTIQATGGSTVTNGNGISGDPTINTAGNGGDKKWENLGIYYSAGTLTIKGANGNDLGANNPGYIYIPHPTNHGQIVVIEITSNFSFDDAAGTSDIIGNTFGTTASTAWGEDCPFFVYMVINDDADAVVPCLMRSGWRDTVSVVGKPSDASADQDTYAWAFEDVTLADYSGNPGVCIGAIRMQKDASDDWTVQALDGHDGVGRFHESTLFYMPQGQNGAAANTFIKSNAGTEPQFNTEEYIYHIKRDSTIEVIIYMTTCTVAGVGAQNCGFVLPIRSRYSNHQATGINGSFYDQSGAAYYNVGVSGGGGNDSIFCHGPGPGSLYTNATFSVNDSIYYGGTYEAY